MNTHAILPAPGGRAPEQATLDGPAPSAPAASAGAMAAERLSMRQIRDLLRQKWALGLSHRAAAQSLGIGLGTISSIVSRAQAAGLAWTQVQGLPDDALDGWLYGWPALQSLQIHL